MSFEVSVNTLTQGAGALAVDNQDLTKPGNHGIINEFAQSHFRFVHHHAADIDIPADILCFLQEAGRLGILMTAGIITGLFLCLMGNKGAGIGFELSAQSAYLYGQILALNFEDSALLVQFLDIDRIAHTDFFEVYALTNTLLCHNAGVRFGRSFVDTCAGIGDGLLEGGLCSDKFKFGIIFYCVNNSSLSWLMTSSDSRRV